MDEAVPLISRVIAAPKSHQKKLDSAKKTLQSPRGVISTYTAHQSSIMEDGTWMYALATHKHTNPPKPY
jgi:hypothetical protein